ncbi:ribosome biogenesis protein bop1 [Silurus asotus]|uniref:Ribosome biogenesis protein bop1 n=1 Tax=Silurus asotus TaxID=30991 RepID=A0AAD4ZZP3_SILAS|nr:ribosome biogenesis protein bop1 [Silurus asotus]
MPESGSELKRNVAMSKVQAKKRNVQEEEDEDELFTPLSGHLDDSDEGNDDLSDSEESVFSGLEDSGSDDESSDDADDEEAEEEAGVSENGKSTREAESSESFTKTVGKAQTDDKTAKNRKPKKENRMAKKDDTEDKSVKSDRVGGLNVSSQVDEYDHDTSDEELSATLFGMGCLEQNKLMLSRVESGQTSLLVIC